MGEVHWVRLSTTMGLLRGMVKSVVREHKVDCLVSLCCLFTMVLLLKQMYFNVDMHIYPVAVGATGNHEDKELQRTRSCLLELLSDVSIWCHKDHFNLPCSPHWKTYCTDVLESHYSLKLMGKSNIFNHHVYKNTVIGWVYRGGSTIFIPREVVKIAPTLQLKQTLLHEIFHIALGISDIAYAFEPHFQGLSSEEKCRNPDSLIKIIEESRSWRVLY